MLYQTENRHGGDIYGGIALDFSANVSPLGTPRSVTDAIERALPELYRYPDPYCRTLVQTISEYEGVPKNFVLCGNGASELIYAYCGAVRPKRAMELAPTFSEYSLALRRTGCEVVRFALKQEENFDLRKDFLPFLAREKIDALFLCNPNNPTGRLIAGGLLEKILQVLNVFFSLVAVLLGLVLIFQGLFTNTTLLMMGLLLLLLGPLLCRVGYELILLRIMQVKATREINRKLSFLVPEGAAQAAEEEDLREEPEKEAPTTAKTPTEPPRAHCPSCGTWYQEALGKCPVCGRAHEKDES